MKNSDSFHTFVQNIDCGYLLEPPRRGGSNEYPQSMFSRNKKFNVYPCKHQFFLYENGRIASTIYDKPYHFDSDVYFAFLDGNDILRHYGGYTKLYIAYLSLSHSSLNSQHSAWNISRCRWPTCMKEWCLGYTMVRAHVRCDNARAWASALSHVHAQNHGKYWFITFACM